MSVVLPKHVMDAVKDHAASVGFKSPQFKISVGSRNGDNFSGDVYRIVISQSDREAQDCDNNNTDGTIVAIPRVISVIAKVAPTTPLRRSLYNSSAHFRREKYIFDIVLPTFEKFQQTRGLKASRLFDHYPRALASDISEGQELILLNDLVAEGYGNFERTKPLDFDNVKQILIDLAQFHAVSFAMKDQAPQIFNQIVGQLEEIIFVAPLHSDFEGFLKRQVGYAIKTLEQLPIEGDAAVSERLCQFRDEYGAAMVETCSNREDAVVCHGDCWISNIMFRKMSKLHPTELKFIDWQVSRCATPVIDLSYFIFCCTDAELRKRLPELFLSYHAALVERIDELGSDGHRLFPLETLQTHLKKYCRFGFGMALMMLHSTCCVDMPDVSATLENELKDLDKFATDLLYNPVYIERMKGVCRDMVRMGYL